MFKANNKHDRELQILSSLKVYIFYILLFSFAVNLLSLAVPLYAMQVFDRVLVSRNLMTLLYLSIITIFVIIVMGSFSYFRTRMQYHFANAFAKKVKAISMALDLYGKDPLGGTMKTSTYIEQLRAFIAGPTASAISDIPFVPIFAITLYIIHPALLTTAFLGGISLLLIGFVGEVIFKKKHAVLFDKQIKHSHYSDSLTKGHDAINAMHLQKPIFMKWLNKENDLMDNANNIHRNTKFVYEMAKTLRVIIQCAITGITAYYIVLGEVNTGAILVVAALASKVIAPFERLLSSWGQVIKAFESYKKIQSIFEVPLPDDAFSFAPQGGKVEVDRLSYRSPDGKRKLIIKNMSFAVGPGEVVIITGMSGAGKSTLLKLLAGIEAPSLGTVKIDGAEISQQYGDIGNSIGFFGQNNDFFPASVKKNISRMIEDVDDQEIIKASMAAGAHEFILALPQGYDTMIGPGGAYISMGQRQKIGLARALFGSPRLVYLDEPNAHLDKSGEQKLITAIKKLKEDKVTCFVTAHKASLLEVADKILIINDGELISFGNVNDVMKEQHIKMLEAQNKKNSSGEDKV